MLILEDKLNILENQKILINEKILITGATGFIGSHLTELLVKTGYKVIAFDRYNLITILLLSDLNLKMILNLILAIFEIMTQSKKRLKS